MSIQYKNIKPWGRSYKEYLQMFNLTESELNLNILGCADGPASFNSKMSKLGKNTISVDPIYRFSAIEIESKINESYEDILTQTTNNKDKFIWTNINSPEELGEIRMQSMKLFLADFESGKLEGRYINAELPNLPFKDNEFDLILCSHFLFLYTDNLSLDFHVKSIKEMLRIAREIRIFPLLDCNAIKSRYVKELNEYFDDLIIEEIKTNYEFQKGGNEMLKIKHIKNNQI